MTNTPNELQRVWRVVEAIPAINDLSAQYQNDIAEAILSERAELLARSERMRGALEGFVEGIERAPISWETGCCCCGSPVDSHGFGDGHSPVDEGVYFITQLIKAARAALTTGEATTPNAGERG